MHPLSSCFYYKWLNKEYIKLCHNLEFFPILHWISTSKYKLWIYFLSPMLSLEWLNTGCWSNLQLPSFYASRKEIEKFRFYPCMLFARDQKREGKVESQGKTLLVMTKNADRVCLSELSINVSNFRDHSMYHRNPIKYPTCAL